MVNHNFTGLSIVIRGVQRRESSPWVTSFISFSFSLSFPTHPDFSFSANSITQTLTQRAAAGVRFSQKARLIPSKSQVGDL